MADGDIARELRTALRLWHTYADRRLSSLGFNQATWSALLGLQACRDAPPTQTELAVILGVTPQSLVRHLDLLEHDGWIERRRTDVDRRTKTVHLTERCEERLPSIVREVGSIQNELLSSLPAFLSVQLKHCLEALQISLSARLSELEIESVD
jgi:DNA-binding MarR family transcriptional regulator